MRLTEQIRALTESFDEIDMLQAIAELQKRGGVTRRQLVKQTPMSRGQVTRLLKRLRDDHAITGDKRGMRLSPSGWATLERLGGKFRPPPRSGGSGKSTVPDDDFYFVGEARRLAKIRALTEARFPVSLIDADTGEVVWTGPADELIRDNGGDPGVVAAVAQLNKGKKRVRMGGGAAGGFVLKKAPR